MTPEQANAVIGLLTEIRDLLKTSPRQSSAKSTGSGRKVAAAFCKIKATGEWGIRTPEKPTPGETIEVGTKGGKIMKRKIKAIAWQGQDRETNQHIYVCSVYDRDEDKNGSTSANEAPPVTAKQPEDDDQVPF